MSALSGSRTRQRASRPATAAASARWPWLLLGLLTVAATVIAGFPASWVASYAEQLSGGRVILASASGTLWKGSAVLALRPRTASAVTTALPGRLEWTLAPLALLRGDLSVKLAHDEAMAQAVDLTVNRHGLRIVPGTLTLPASLLEGLGAPFNTLRPDGRLTASWSAIAIHRDGASAAGAINTGQISLRLDRMSSAVSPMRPLGSYQLLLKFQEQGTIALQLDTLQGPLLLNGQGAIEQGKLRFDGTAIAVPEAREQLAGLIGILGPRDGNGARLTLQ